MKNQLAKESYAEQWEDIVRSGAASSVKRHSESSTSAPSGEGSEGQPSATGSAPTSRLPAGFGTRDKVPAKGTAPMGPQDYDDGSQWTERNGTLQRWESDKDSAKAESSDGARDGGYIGGDGANVGGADRQQVTDGATDLASSSQKLSGQDQEDSTLAASRKQPQGSGQLPDQARASAARGNNGAGPISNSGARQSASTSASSNGSKPDGGKDRLASNDSDWWREVTAASKKNDCSSAVSALTPKPGHHNGANGSTAGVQNGAKQDMKSMQQDGAGSPSSSSSSSSITSRKRADAESLSPSPSERVSFSKDTSSSSSMHGLRGQSQNTSRASSSKNAPLSSEDKADIAHRTQEVKELASKIENQVFVHLQVWACKDVYCHERILCTGIHSLFWRVTMSLITGHVVATGAGPLHFTSIYHGVLVVLHSLLLCSHLSFSHVTTFLFERAFTGFVLSQEPGPASKSNKKQPQPPPSDIEYWI